MRQSMWICLYSSWPAGETSFAGQQVLGQHFLKLDGSYGEEFTPVIAQWVYNYVYDASRPISFGWNMKRSKLSAAIAVQFYRFGALGEWVKDAVLIEGEPTRIGQTETSCPAFSLEAKEKDTYDQEPYIALSHGPFGGMTVQSKTLLGPQTPRIFAYFHLAIWSHL